MKLLFVLLLCCGCTITEPRWVNEVGYVDSKIGTRTLFDSTDQQPITAVEYSFRAEAETWRSKHFAIDLGLGPVAVVPLREHSGEVFGGEAIGRLIWKAGEIEPYLSVTQGAVYHEQAWEPVTEKYAFPTEFGIGIRKRFGNNLINLEYRWWHNSWGASKLGSDFRSAFNLGNDGPNPGYEGGALFLSVSVPF